MISDGSSMSVESATTKGNLPNMSGTIVGWFQRIIIGVLDKRIVNNRVEETTTTYETNGVVQPFTYEQLMIKPEGQRSWKWYMIHCQPSLPLRTDDTITYKGERYRVMNKWGYDDYGYIQYDIVKDYDTVIPPTP